MGGMLNNQMNYQMTSKNKNNPLNYKIVKCKNFEKDGTCKYGNHCTFAHGDNDLRTKTDNMNQLQSNMPGMNMGMGNIPGVMPMMDMNMMQMMGVNMGMGNMDMNQMAMPNQFDPNMMMGGQIQQQGMDVMAQEMMQRDQENN